VFSSFFEKKDMERVIWHILSAYKSLFCDSSYNTDDREPKNVMMESAVLGALHYAQEAKLNEVDFHKFFVQRVAEHIEKNNNISLEIMCFIAASLRGDFEKNSKHLGLFLGTSLRKLNLSSDAFESYAMLNSNGFLLIAKMNLVRFLAAKNK
jgi:hypothetical protein